MQKNWKITMNAPVTLTFGFICVCAFLANIITNGVSNRLLFMTYHSSMLSPLTWIRMFTHCMGHGSWAHLIGNMSYILLLGPILEEKYGSKSLLEIIVVTAFITGLVNYFLFPRAALLGASGIVFALILLSSLTSFKAGEIPLTFILVSVIYLGGQVYDALFVVDNIANFAHIIGGLVGAIAGFNFVKNK